VKRYVGKFPKTNFNTLQVTTVKKYSKARQADGAVKVHTIWYNAIPKSLNKAYHVPTAIQSENAMETLVVSTARFHNDADRLDSFVRASLEKALKSARIFSQIACVKSR
jgi:hypothetical protein